MPKTVLTTERLPIILWSPFEEGPDDAVLTQFRNLANHPLAFRHVCGMPDYHVGYGMPIGGVVATEGGVIPNAVGVDIGCGMIAVETQVRAADTSREQLHALRIAIHQRLPVGMTHHSAPQKMDVPPAPFRESIVQAEWERARKQIGTLGSGNHFIEVQRDQSTDQVWIMLHSGSRNVGLRVCNYYHKIARSLLELSATALPDPDLAFLPGDVEAHDQYLAEMRWCMAFAEANREAMLQAVYGSFRDELGVEIEERRKVDTHHNFAELETHFGREVLVHRKGAVRADGLVTIPGSMGTASYIAEGLRPIESFNTCSHGAGRLLGRKQANRMITHQEAEAAMSEVVFGVRQGDYDEMPMAYKDIDAVMAAQADLARPVHRLLPLAVVKG